MHVNHVKIFDLGVYICMCADMYIEKGGKRITSLKMMANTAIRQKYAKEIFSEGLCSVLHPLTETTRS